MHTVMHNSASKQANKPTYTHVLQCSPASVGLAQARPNYYPKKFWAYFPKVVRTNEIVRSAIIALPLQQ